MRCNSSLHPAPQVETQRRLWEEKEAKAKMEAAAKEELERKRVERQVTAATSSFPLWSGSTGGCRLAYVHVYVVTDYVHPALHFYARALRLRLRSGSCPARFPPASQEFLAQKKEKLRQQQEDAAHARASSFCHAACSFLPAHALCLRKGRSDSRAGCHAFRWHSGAEEG
jgi:hypothetical protein